MVNTTVTVWIRLIFQGPVAKILVDFHRISCLIVKLDEEREMAILLEINSYTPQPRMIGQVVDILRKGGVICYPTDTMYGIGCDIFNQKAVKRVHQLKRRPKHKPFSFMCSDLKNIS